MIKIKQVRYCPPNASFSMAGTQFNLYKDENKYFFCIDANGAPYNKTEIESEEAFDKYVEDFCK